MRELPVMEELMRESPPKFSQQDPGSELSLGVDRTIRTRDVTGSPSTLGDDQSIIDVNLDLRESGVDFSLWDETMFHQSPLGDINLSLDGVTVDLYTDIPGTRAHRTTAGGVEGAAGEKSEKSQGKKKYLHNFFPQIQQMSGLPHPLKADEGFPSLSR